MPARDGDTLDFYAAEAQAYAGRDREAENALIARFAALLQPGARILELGCGGGQDSAAMLAQGFDVVPSDGSPELAAEAGRRLGVPVRVLLFEDLDEVEAYDAVWAHASLLHVPRAALPGILARIARALRPGGVFFASFKAGEAEGRDRFGRYFNYPSEDWLRGAYGAESWTSIAIEEATGSGYDAEPTRWLHVFAVKDAFAVRNASAVKNA
jgi:SAM-dependent methyltransferase